MSNVERPPIGTWVRYRLFGSRVPDRYLAWVEQDIRSAMWPWLAGSPLPMIVVFALFVTRMFTDDTNVSTIVWYVVALAFGIGLSLILQRVPGWRRMIDRRRTLALRYQRGDITRDEWSGLQHGAFSWRILALALGVGAVVFITLFVLDRL